MNATEAQIDYINILRNGLLEQMNKPFSENIYRGHFGDFMRSKSRQMKLNGIGEDKFERNQMVINEFYPQWVKSVGERLDFDPTQLDKSAASKMIDNLKKPASILRVEL